MKRILIVYNSFDEWSMGPIRLRRIVRQLPAAGYQPVVLTSEVSKRTSVEIPDGLECLRAKGVDLAELYARLRGIRAARRGQDRHDDGSIAKGRSSRLTTMINRWLMVPEKQITWRGPAIRAARAYLREHPVDAIFASLAPRTNLLVGARLAREFNLPYIMEFRDLWTGSPYYHMAQPTALHRWLHRRMERGAVCAATRITAVCKGIAAYLEATYPDELEQPPTLNYNFYDPEEYPAERPARPTGPMVISYIGAFYVNRSPDSFFRAFRRFIDRHDLTPQDVCFRWAGQVINVAGVDDVIRELGLEPFIHRLGMLSHDAALTELCRSDVSLLIQAPGDTIHIPGKLFEAMGAGVPLLAIAEVDEIREIIERTQAGVYCPHESEAIETALGTFWERHRQGRPWSYNEEARADYRADNTVSRLATLFDDAIESHARST